MILKKFNKALKKLKEKSNKQIFKFGVFLDKLPNISIKDPLTHKKMRTSKDLMKQIAIKQLKEEGVNPFSNLVYLQNMVGVKPQQMEVYNPNNGLGYWVDKDYGIIWVFPDLGIIKLGGSLAIETVTKEQVDEITKDLLDRFANNLSENADEVIEDIAQDYIFAKGMGIPLKQLVSKNGIFKNFDKKNHELIIRNGRGILDGKRITNAELDTVQALIKNGMSITVKSEKVNHPCLKLFEDKDRTAVSQYLGKLGVVPESLLPIVMGDSKMDIKKMPKVKKEVFPDFTVADAVGGAILVDTRHNIYIGLYARISFKENIERVEHLGEEALRNRIDSYLEDFVYEVTQLA
jgi:hypothetical protein